MNEWLDHVDEVDARLAALDIEIGARFAVREALIALLDSTPGIDQPTIRAILADIGPDGRRWPEAVVWLCGPPPTVGL